ncbi:MAG TPA: sigma-54 dependent transcriptional regulator [Pyrinomonadaceae bacterium]|nr:sigma-54 dependent transcriptional regulator [Pyrinomonadaceae bacterium]
MLTAPLIGQSTAHCRLIEKLTRASATTAEVLITGPTGVGKELYAQFVHRKSPRSERPFVAVNCGALPTDLLENELFGHVRGAFTGARAQSEGLVAEAESGTLFLDEVDSLSLPSQVKVLRFIQSKEYRRLGDTRVRRANVRIIAATNTDLLAAVQAGTFREDLFYRLRVFPVEVLPLRERREDISLLVKEYARLYADEYSVTPVEFHEQTARWLERYSWPGNVRELANCVHYLTCLQLDRPAELSDLPLLNFEEEEDSARARALVRRSFQEAKRELINQFERDYLAAALRASGGNIAEAARLSGKARRAFFELMRKYGLKAADFAQNGHAGSAANGGRSDSVALRNSSLGGAKGGGVLKA